MIPGLNERIIRAPFLGTWGITLYPFIFLGKAAKGDVLRHELTHYRQQDKWWAIAGPLGVLAWILVYLLVLPIGFNPWRSCWEYEAYRMGQNLTDRQIQAKLRRWPYFLFWGA